MATLKNALKLVYMGLIEKQGFSPTRAEGLCDALRYGAINSAAGAKAKEKFEENGWDKFKGAMGIKDN